MCDPPAFLPLSTCRLQKFKEVWPDGYGDEFRGTKYDVVPKIERLRAEAEYRRTYGTLRRTHVAPIQREAGESLAEPGQVPPQCTAQGDAPAPAEG